MHQQPIVIYGFCLKQHSNLQQFDDEYNDILTRQPQNYIPNYTSTHIHQLKSGCPKITLVWTKVLNNCLPKVKRLLSYYLRMSAEPLETNF